MKIGEDDEPKVNMIKVRGRQSEYFLSIRLMDGNGQVFKHTLSYSYDVIRAKVKTFRCNFRLAAENFTVHMESGAPIAQCTSVHCNSPTLTLIGWGSLVLQKPQNKPRNWINGQRPELENGIKIGTWNVRTLNKPGALQYLLDAIKKYNTNILALQEIRWPNHGNMKKEDKTIFY
ncbi:craniofacial development protein 2-like, partial [Aphis craccivora]